MIEINIAGMTFDEGQIAALRSYFREEWQREEIRGAISVIMEVLSAHNGGDPDDEADQQISLRLLEKDIEDDIVARFHHRVPEWNEEALREANNHDVGVWRSLYDIIVPEMRAKLRKEAASKVRTYPVNGKTYTEEEVIAIYDMWKGIQDNNALSESVDIALDMLNDEDIREYAHNNDPDIMEQCRKSRLDWGVWQDECLSHHCLLPALPRQGQAEGDVRGVQEGGRRLNAKIKQYREDITARIIKALEEGTAPWLKPWNGEGAPHNAVTGRKYNGINAIVLATSGWNIDGGRDPRWLTFKQAEAKGWNIRKGEHGTRITFWKPVAIIQEDAQGEPLLNDEGSPLMKNILMEKPFTVFHASQVEGIDAYSPAPINAVEANEKAERIIEDSGADIRHGGFRAFYRPGEDFIQLPPMMYFTDTAGYYATALHEMVHWTGHESRLDRDKGGKYGTPSYAREELVAEIGSMFVSCETGVPQTDEHFKNHAAYISSWISLLTSDSSAIFKAASEANKAAEFLLQKERAREAASAAETVEEVA